MVGAGDKIKRVRDLGKQRMMVWTVVVWFSLASLYLLLAGDLSPFELSAGIVCATAGAGFATSLSRVRDRGFAGSPPARAILRPVAALVSETLFVGQALVAAILTPKDRRGAFVRQRFDPGGDNPASAGRRAAVVLGVSLAPGSFVVRGDRTDTMILHALPPRAPSVDRVWPA